MSQLILVSDAESSVHASLSQAGSLLDVQVMPDSLSELMADARARNPSLVVLDVGQDEGLEVLSMLKSSKDTHSIPVVVIGGAERPDLRELSLELGAEAFVTKPVGADFLPKVLTWLKAR